MDKKEMMGDKTMEKMMIKETTKRDLMNIWSLWNNVEVMRHVGYPKGTNTSMLQVEEWYHCLERRRPETNHFSIYGEVIGYCGEVGYYKTGKQGLASLDIKLLASARGKRFAYQGLTYTIEKAFSADVHALWVKIDIHNTKAISLFRQLGFQTLALPDTVAERESMVYLKLRKDTWLWNHSGEINNKKCLEKQI